jgi:hypothetical protein
VVYVPHGQLATRPINHVAKISNLKKIKKKFQFKKNMNILATWLIGDVAIIHMANWRRDKIHVANYQRKAFRYIVDYPHGKIALWIITTSRNRHVDTVPSTVTTWLKTKFFVVIGRLFCILLV